LFVNACDCTNPNQGLPTVTDKQPGEEEMTQNVVMMKVEPNKLEGDEREVKIHFTLLNDFTEVLLSRCRLKIVCTQPVEASKASYLKYLDNQLTECRKASVDEELTYFQLVPLGGQSKILTLSVDLIPYIEVAQLEVKFELYDEKGVLLQNDKVVWERAKDAPYKLKMEPRGESKIIEECGEQKEFTVKVNNVGENITEADQLKLIITRIEGKDATLSIAGQNSPVQELNLGKLANNQIIDKSFVIHSVTDKSAKFLFQLLCKEEEQDFLYVNWEKIIPSIKVEYLRKTNQVHYTISNFQALQLESLKLRYKNLSNNTVTLGNVTEDAISLFGDYSSMPVHFNNNANAEFKFELLYKDSPVATETIILKNVQLKITGIGARQVMRGKAPTGFYVKNVSGVPINIKQLYIQCSNMNGASFKFRSVSGHTAKSDLKSKLSDFTEKEVLEVDEQVPITIQLEDSNNQSNLDFNLEVYDESEGSAVLLHERSLIWMQS
jgi:hypothetical protein